MPPQSSIQNVCPDANSYIIKKGDTLYNISKKFNISLDDLIEANPGVNSKIILPGQIICIPLATPPVKCPIGILPYVVRSGDTFYSIARTFKTTVKLLMLANVKINPDALLIGQKLCIPGPGNKFISQKLKVSLLFPLNWSKVSEDKYKGVDGFFQVSAIRGASLKDVCEGEAFHKLMPYGSSPTIMNTSIKGQHACFIFPYPDQPPEMQNQAALIVTYPKPIIISGESYNFFILWADNNHIKEISNTVSFLI